MFYVDLCKTRAQSVKSSAKNSVLTTHYKQQFELQAFSKSSLRAVEFWVLILMFQVM